MCLIVGLVKTIVVIVEVLCLKQKKTDAHTAVLNEYMYIYVECNACFTIESVFTQKLDCCRRRFEI